MNYRELNILLRVIIALLIALLVWCWHDIDDVEAEENDLANLPYRDICDKYQEEYGISSNLVQALIIIESSNEPSAQNGNCIGLCQINTKIHRNLIHDLGYTEQDMWLAEPNIHVAFELIYQLSEIYGEAYPTLNAYGGFKEPYNTTRYADKVFELCREIEVARYGN